MWGSTKSRSSRSSTGGKRIPTTCSPPASSATGSAASSLRDRKPVDGLAGVPLARIQHRARKAGLVHAVREVRRLEAETRPQSIDHAALADVARPLPFEEIAGVELQAGLARPDLHGTAAFRLADACREAE